MPRNINCKYGMFQKKVCSKHRTDSKLGQDSCLMTPSVGTGTSTRHKNRQRTTPTAPDLSRANTDSFETVLLSHGNIISCSGLEAPYGEMFFYDVDVSDGSLGGVGSTHIQMPPATPPPSCIHTPCKNKCTHRAEQSWCLWKSKDVNWWLILFIFSLRLFMCVSVFVCLVRNESCAFVLTKVKLILFL